MASAELSRLIRDYYQHEAERLGLRSEYERWVGAVWEELADLERQGVNAAFLLHVLMCTRLGRLTPNWSTSPTLAEMPPRQRRSLLRAVRTLRALGEQQILGLFGADQEAGQQFSLGLMRLEHLLSSGTYVAPTFRIGTRGLIGPRHRELYTTACLICLMSELKGHPKRAACTAVLMEKCDLLRGRRGSVVEKVKKRHQRAGASGQLKDPLSALATRVRLLRLTFESLKEHLAPEPVKPVPPNQLRAKAKQWRVPLQVFTRRFQDFCRVAGLKPDGAGLSEFQRTLKREAKLVGVQPLRADLVRGPFLDDVG